MLDNKQAPRCPYCGAEMRIEKPIFANEYDASLVGAKAGWFTQATCTKCWSVAPFVYGTETEKDAYEVVREKAMRRWQEPNRVLTLEEVLEIASSDYNTPEQETVLWLERRVDEGGYATIPNIFAEDGKIVAEFSGIGFEVALITEGYGKLWRCWRRKPTKNERENTPWEESKNEV